MEFLNLDMALTQLHNGLDMLYVVYEAMAEHSEKQPAYSDALYGVLDYLRLVECKLNETAEAIKRGTVKGLF